MKLFYSEDGDKEMAVYYFHKAAKMGNAQGEYMNGMAYFTGRGIHYSWKSAFDCFSRAIENGSLDAMVELALMYRYGIGIERNTMKALELYMKAAEHGNGRAMIELGNVFKTGELGIKDNEKSEEYYAQAYEVLYESAMEDNDPIAQHLLGSMYLDGEGIKRSYTQAIKYFERAIKNNYPPSFNAMGVCYACGFGVAADINKAFEYKRKSAMMGFPTAMNNLSVCYIQGIGVDKDIEKYHEWQMKAAECGNVGALCNIGRDYLSGEFQPKDIDKAKKWFEKAIEAGSLEAMLCLGVMYENGEIDDPHGMDKAVKLYKQAAISGEVISMKCIAICYYYGNGTKVDKVNAAHWYLKIAEIYQEMIANDDSCFTSQLGAGIIDDCDFDAYYQRLFAECFENLADMYRKGEGGLEVNSLLADKWSKVCRVLRGEVENVEESDNSLYRIKGHNGLWGYANAAGMVVIPCNWTYTKDFVDDVALVWKGKKMGAINRKGEYYFDCKINCQKATYLGHNLIKVYDGSLYRICTLEGKDELMGLFERLENKFEDGFVKAVKYRLFGKNKPGRIDKSGNFIPD